MIITQILLGVSLMVCGMILIIKLPPARPSLTPWTLVCDEAGQFSYTAWDGVMSNTTYKTRKKAICAKHGNGFRVYSATAAHRAEAFLRTLGLWTGDK
ncbi:MAG: hypothetical protein H0U18_16045 [Pyrinomonadaceae bacterium]|nr:hypothetical protein [Pyrinomonadaceae bacterium]